MGVKSNSYVGFSKEVEEDWKHLFLEDKVFLEAWHLNYLFKLLNLLVTIVTKEVVVVVTNDGREKPAHLFVIDLKKTLVHCITDDRLPDVVVDLIKMLNKRAFIKALIAIIVLDQGEKIISM